MKTFEDWKKIYYPISAEELVYSLEDEPNITKVNIELTKHALQKWKGIRPEVLAEFGLAQHPVDRRGIYSYHENKIVFYLSSATCTLCREYLLCGGCPLLQLHNLTCFDDESPYQEFLRTGNPEPMIQELEEILADLERQHEEMTRK